VRAVNLIPAEQRPGGAVGAGRSGGAAYAVVALVAGLALMALLYGVAHKQISDRQSEVASLQTRAQRAEQQAAALASYTSFVQMRQQRVSAVEGLVDSRFDWAHVMHEFGRVLPAGVALSSLSGTIGSVSPGGAATAKPTASTSGSSSASSPASSGSSVTPPGSVPSFQITGCARTQSNVAQVLTRLRLIDGVSEVTLQASSRGSSSGGGVSGAAGVGCPQTYTNFAATVTFQPLPSATAAVAASAAHATTVSTGVSGK
jgi:Tfp pilus assembly protein PilN